MTIKKAYYYLFYKYYKFGELSYSSFPSDFTATASIVFLEVLFLSSLRVYYFDFIDRSCDFEFGSYVTLIPLFIVFLINYMAFLANDNWKNYVHEFDQLPKRKNARGTLIVIIITLLIVINLALSFHIMGKITGVAD
ncbi:hypothetical protein ABIB50_001879 [Mucilaginibacter sp. UYCu711]